MCKIHKKTQQKMLIWQNAFSKKQKNLKRKRNIDIPALMW